MTTNPIAERNGWGKGPDGETCETCTACVLLGYVCPVCILADNSKVNRHWPACGKWQSAVRKEGEGQE